MADFELAYPKSKKNEGGYAHIDGDTGLETYGGVSRKWFPHWEGWKIVDQHKPLRNGQVIKDPVLEGMLKSFYKKVFWDAIGGDKVNDQPTAERLYDFGINSGQPKSIKQIQEVLGIAQTGKLDATTIDAINNPAKYLA